MLFDVAPCLVFGVWCSVFVARCSLCVVWCSLFVVPCWLIMACFCCA